MYFIPSEPGNGLKSHFEEQNFIQEQQQKKEFMESVQEIARSAKTQADIAVKTSKKADIKGWIAVILSGIALFFEFAVNQDAIIDFIEQIIKSF